MQGHMRAQEVVVSDKQGSQRDGSIGAIEAVRRSHMMFISSVKPFDKLFKGSELF